MTDIPESSVQLSMTVIEHKNCKNTIRDVLFFFFFKLDHPQCMDEVSIPSTGKALITEVIAVKRNISTIDIKSNLEVGRIAVSDIFHA